MANIFSKLRGLIPTARVDKNGRVVIRHMKPEEMGAGEPKTPIPPPHDGRPKASAALAMEAMEFLAVAMEFDHYDYEPAMDTMNRHMGDLLPATIQRILSLKNSDEGNVVYSVYNEFHEEKINETYINDLVQLSSHISKHEMGLEEKSTFVRGLQRYDGLCLMGDGDSYPEERYSQCIALFDTAYQIHQKIKSGDMDKSEMNQTQDFFDPIITNERLVAFILNSKDTDREKIADIVGERGIIDPDGIKALIDAGDVAALSSGAL